jgi:hypothetical protein
MIRVAFHWYWRDIPGYKKPAKKSILGWSFLGKAANAIC